MNKASTEDTGKWILMHSSLLSPMKRKSDTVVAAQLNGTKAVWTHNAPVPDPASSNMRKAADSVEKLLQVESSGDELTAATILFVALNHRSMKGVGN
jgi:hypothetical protein